MNDWLDKWTEVHKLPKTLRAAGRWAARSGRADDLILEPKLEPKRRVGQRRRQPHGPAFTPSTILPLADSLYILKRGKKAYRAMKAREDAPASLPVEFNDPAAQSAFEAVYKNRLHMLRENEIC